MVKKQQSEILQKLKPIYDKVVTPTWCGNEGDYYTKPGTGPGEGRWERNAVGYEGVLVLEEYRKNGRDFDPIFPYELEEQGIRCDHSPTSFFMILLNARSKFAEVTGMTFRDWLEANGQRVDHLHDNTKSELRVARNYRTETPEEKAEREERFRKTVQEDRSGWEAQSLFDEAEAPEQTIKKPASSDAPKAKKVTKKAAKSSQKNEITTNFFALAGIDLGEQKKPELSPEEKMAEYQVALGKTNHLTSPDP